LIPEQLASFIAVQWFVVVALIGAALGVATSFALRLRWHWWRPFGDMLVALLTTVALMVAAGLYQRNREYRDLGWFFQLVGVAAPALVHILIFLIRRSGRAAQYP